MKPVQGISISLGFNLNQSAVFYPIDVGFLTSNGV